MEAHNGHYVRSDRIWSMSSVLTKEQFQCLQCIFVDELTQEETAREIGLSRRMVRHLLNQAFNRIREAGNVVIDFDPPKI